jgi:hypothetical protein
MGFIYGVVNVCAVENERLKRQRKISGGSAMVVDLSYCEAWHFLLDFLCMLDRVLLWWWK